ncbi:MAG: 16S rRNA (guanine(966)-N(2))-methyltransferase RsmD [Thermoanaerobacteraceae bacterium]|nr:16S rRNA (guanine(966)-N(2))-methyltransferase RsmD [Thermoanaerobacteraceae bacterium]
MRIVSGIARGRKLKCPPGREVRPTADMVKEALFNIIGQDVIDCIFLDLFAGTGSVGIEALSRGASFCYFVEKVYNNIKYIKKNISLSNLTDKGQIIHKDANEALIIFNKAGIKFDIIYIDPPYYKNLYEKPLIYISKSKILKDNGYIIVEHHKADILKDRYDNLERIRIKSYSETCLSFYKEVTYENCGISGQF